MWNVARCGRIAGTWLVAIALLGGFLLVMPNYHGGHRDPSRHRRACFANQRTIAGAVEMYNLDFDTAITSLDVAILTTLKENGYLQAVPRDIPSDSEEEGRTNYRICEAGVYCIRHGFIGGDHGLGCRDQLRAAGIHDPDLLGEALSEPADLPDRWRLDLGLDLFLLGLAIVLALHRLLDALNPFLFSEGADDLAFWSSRRGRSRLAELERHENALAERLVLDLLVAVPFVLPGVGAALAEFRTVPVLAAGILVIVGLGWVDGAGLARTMRRRHRNLSARPLPPEDATVSGTLLVIATALLLVRSGSFPGGAAPLSNVALLGALFAQAGLARGFARRRLMEWHEELEDRIATRARLCGRPGRPVVHELALPPMRLRLEHARCPVCGEDFRGTEAVLCADCGTPHHPACLAWNGRCATYGCGATRARAIGRGQAVAGAR